MHLQSIVVLHKLHVHVHTCTCTYMYKMIIFAQQTKQLAPSSRTSITQEFKFKQSSIYKYVYAAENWKGGKFIYVVLQGSALIDVHPLSGDGYEITGHLCRLS